MMLCPNCTGPTRVYDTRRRKDGNVQRRRRCGESGCYAKFVTLERVTTMAKARKHLSVMSSAP